MQLLNFRLQKYCIDNLEIDFLNSNIRCRDFIDIWNIHWEGNQSAKHPEFIDLKNPVVKVRKKNLQMKQKHISNGELY